MEVKTRIMIANCKGCNEDLNFAYWLQSLGYHLAVNPFEKGHLFIIIVNDRGKIVVE